MNKVFIDGSAGTTGLRIYERLGGRKDIQLLTIDEEDRKNTQKRADIINSADIAFLCLPDAAAKEIVPLVSPSVKLLDTSTAHRTEDGWVYGFPELHFGHQRSAVAKANRVAVPGCHASGFIALCAPLIDMRIADSDYPFFAHSVTGYSGGGKGMIADYGQNAADAEHTSPRQYALAQAHKHLPEMQKICGLSYKPAFNPIVAGYYSGMVVTVPLTVRLLNDKTSTVSSVAQALAEYYKDEKLIRVHKGGEMPENGFMTSNAMSGSDAMEIFVTGSGEQIMLIARFDNLGKGASGAAVQCMNIMLGTSESEGLEL